MIKNSKFVDKYEKAKNRCYVLADLLNDIRDTYDKSNDDQKALIETVIGAAIWYLPKIDESFSGLISKNAILNLQNKRKISEEHIYPRKVSAKELLEKKDLTRDGLFELYKGKYCKLCYITPEENRRAIQYQKTKTFSTPEVAYQGADIQLIKIFKDKFKKLKKGDAGIVADLLGKDF